jgi:hypothetical protein
MHSKKLLLQASQKLNSRVKLIQTAKFSNLNLANYQDDVDRWPRPRTNFGLNICNQGEKLIVERLGKLHKICEPGWFIAIPVIDQIRFAVDVREKALSIVPQSAITKDNVHVSVSGNLFCQFVDPEKAAYGCVNPMYAVRQHAQSAMRAAIGEFVIKLLIPALLLNKYFYHLLMLF